METVIVAAFLIATFVLLGGGVVLILRGISADEAADIPLLANRFVTRGAGACLIIVAIGFPVVLAGNEKAAPFGLVFSGIFALAAIRLVLGQRARWAGWGGAALIAILVGGAVVTKWQ